MENSTKVYSVEKGFISKLLETKDMGLLKDKQIIPSFFTGENRRIYQFINNTFKDTGEVPTVRVINTKFPSYTLETYKKDGEEVTGTEESLSYWCNELRTKAKHNKMAEILEEVADMLDKSNTEDAYSAIKKGMWFIEDEIVESETVDITKNTSDRKALYLERKKNKGIMGIPTGITHLDYIIKGFVKDTLTTLIAKTGVGKSWVQVLVGTYAMLNNYKVVHFVTEMSAELMQDRYEAMIFGMLYGNFNYGNFKSGCLDVETEKQYFTFLEEDLPKLEPLVIETATGVSSVSAVIERENPDLVMIDGAYLMQDEQGAKDDWLRVTHITRDLKRLAKNRHVPIFINTQADEKSSGTGKIGDIKYSQAIAQDSDNILSLYRDEIMINDKEMGIKVLKNREGVTGKTIINWDFSTMNFQSIYNEEDGGGEEETETPDGVIGIR